MATLLTKQKSTNLTHLNVYNVKPLKIKLILKGQNFATTCFPVGRPLKNGPNWEQLVQLA